MSDKALFIIAALAITCMLLVSEAPNLKKVQDAIRPDYQAYQQAEVLPTDFYKKDMK